MTYNVSDMLSRQEAKDYKLFREAFLSTGNESDGIAVRGFERLARKRYGGAIPAIDALF